ncbi:hypothetical protein [Mesobacillus campisalis]|uniref:hypothetical protein n=1 Tax=Mesobacillus campisalis TaxID=1408103 RepID=UPI000AF34E64|nr:hypothetical protein [Mesobacillus campisalis]
MMKKFIVSFKEGLLMYSNSQYGDVNWQAKRNEMVFAESKPANKKNVCATKKLYMAN